LVEKSQKNLLCLLDRGSLMGDPILSVPFTIGRGCARHILIRYIAIQKIF
jgi:hypothetical protein